MSEPDLHLLARFGERLAPCYHLVFISQPAAAQTKINRLLIFTLQLVLKLHTKNGADHFLEACSREERDNWADDIAAVVDKLRAAAGNQVTKQEEAAGSQLHNINLR